MEFCQWKSSSGVKFEKERKDSEAQKLYLTAVDATEEKLSLVASGLVAQARNMSIGEHRHGCITFRI